jgi:hypothetical protein
MCKRIDCSIILMNPVKYGMRIVRASTTAQREAPEPRPSHVDSWWPVALVRFPSGDLLGSRSENRERFSECLVERPAS